MENYENLISENKGKVELYYILLEENNNQFYFRPLESEKFNKEGEPEYYDNLKEAQADFELIDRDDLINDGFNFVEATLYIIKEIVEGDEVDTEIVDSTIIKNW